MKKVLIKDFRVAGDLFYTEVVRLYCNKAGVDSVSSLDEIDSLQVKVAELMNADSKCPISSSINKANLISRYFIALRIELRDA